MTRKVGGIVFIEPEADSRCELCGAVTETRPYGKNGERICFDCGQKDPETTARKFNELLDGKIQ